MLIYMHSSMTAFLRVSSSHSQNIRTWRKERIPMETTRFRVVVCIPTVYLIGLTRSYKGKNKCLLHVHVASTCTNNCKNNGVFPENMFSLWSRSFGLNSLALSSCQHLWKISFNFLFLFEIPTPFSWNFQCHSMAWVRDILIYRFRPA